MHRLRLLGGIDLHPREGTAGGILTQPRRLGMLVYLALQPAGAWLRRDRILPVFWPELDESAARAALSQSLHVLRRTLGAEVVESRGTDEIRLDPARLETDVARLEAACDRGDFAAALDAYQGELLPGFHLDDAPDFERWLDGRRAGLHRRAREAAAALAGAATGAGDLAQAAVAWHRALELDPHDEVALRGLARTLERQGSRVEALRVAEAFVARLRADLDLEPGAETRSLLVALRRAPPDAEPPDPAPPVVAAVAPAAPVAAPRSPQPVPTAQPSRRSVRLLAIAGVAAVALVVAAVRVFGTRPRATAVEVAVLPFTVRGAPALGYLREGMVDLLATKLDALGTVQAVAPEAVLARVAEEYGGEARTLTPEEAASVARAFGSDLFVLGRAVQVGDAIELAATLFEADGDRAGVATRRAASDADLPAAVDDLVRDLVAVRLSAPAERLERLAVVSSTSHEALRHYLDGERRYRAGDYGGALEAFRGAVAADSLFALAWYRLSVMAGWIASAEHYVPAARRAAELADRLTDHDRTLVHAHYAYARSRWNDAEDGFRSIVARWPDDAEAWYDLGEVLYHANPRRGRPIAESRDAFERVSALIGPAAEPLGHRVALRLLEGGGPELRPMLDTLLTLTPRDAPRAFIWSVLAAVALDDDARLARLVEEAPAHAPQDVLVAAWSVACHTDRLGVADTLVRSLLGDATPLDARLQARALLAQLLVARGRWDEAARELDRLAALDPSRAARYAAGFAAVAPLAGLAADGDSAASLRALERLMRPDPTIPGDSLTGLAFGLHRFRTADSLLALGHQEAARGWLESFPLMFQDELPLVVPALLRLGAVHEATGRRDAARRDYRRIVTLWAGADAPLAPAVARARARLQVLGAR